GTDEPDSILEIVDLSISQILANSVMLIFFRFRISSKRIIIFVSPLSYYVPGDTNYKALYSYIFYHIISRVGVANTQHSSFFDFSYECTKLVMIFVQNALHRERGRI